jgi:hypothetical protein
MTAAGTGHIDLDDSRVVHVNREHGRVTIELEQLRSRTAKRITVSVTGVTHEDAVYYVGHNVTAPHPNPELPLDFVEYAEHRAGQLELGGHLHNKIWFVWTLVATGVEITEHRPRAVAT